MATNSKTDGDNTASATTSDSSGNSAVTASSWKAWWQDFADDQRLQRLADCRQIQEILQQCRQQQGQQNQVLEDCTPGLRMVRYFGWRNLHNSNNCAREVHSLWGCRAISLGCGPDLVRLKECFDERGNNLLQEPDTAYEQSTLRDKLPCQDLQEQLGACVARRAMELEQRQSATR